MNIAHSDKLKSSEVVSGMVLTIGSLVFCPI
jgi:hypothetical protein